MNFKAVKDYEKLKTYIGVHVHVLANSTDEKIMQQLIHIYGKIANSRYQYISQTVAKYATTENLR